MISLIVTLIVLGLIVSLAIYAVRLIPLPPPFPNVIIILIIIACILYLLTMLGGPFHGLRF